MQPLGMIREKLTTRFDDLEIRAICSDYFREVYNLFTIGMTKLQMIDLLLNWCENHDRMQDLLSAIENERPNAFQHAENYMLSNHFYNRHSYDLAIDQIKKCLTKQPYSYKYNLRAGIYYHKRGDNSDTSNDYQSALEYLDRAIQLKPDSLEPYNWKAWTLLDMDDYDLAIEEFSKLISRNTRNANYFLGRGKSYHKQADANEISSGYDLSISDLTQSIRLEKSYSAHYWRGWSFFDLGDYHNAMLDAEETVRLRPKDGEAYYLRGRIQEMLGNLLEANSDFEISYRLGFALAGEKLE